MPTHVRKTPHVPTHVWKTPHVPTHIWKTPHAPNAVFGGCKICKVDVCACLPKGFFLRINVYSGSILFVLSLLNGDKTKVAYYLKRFVIPILIQYWSITRSRRPKNLLRNLCELSLWFFGLCPMKFVQNKKKVLWNFFITNFRTRQTVDSKW